ncbi:MAG: prepilin-type N-terminal cleavage/methylation domain-containing protein [Planctomycetes bacterium]|nr:prepilin-type N-terminal cleavage/methylation domain-containing protein [Planctomycetota bacterium]
MTEHIAAGPAPRAGEQGFTLLEVLVALGMLTIGLTTLLGALALGAGTRRGAEMRVRASLLADQVLQHVENELLAEHPLPEDWEKDADLAIPAANDGEAAAALAGFPGMAWRASFTTSAERPESVLVRIEISWRDDGENDGETFVRILPRSVPLARRVAQRKQAQ